MRRRGDRVLITTGKYAGQSGNIKKKARPPHLHGVGGR